MLQKIKINDKITVGEGYPSFIVAEVASNHDNDILKAKKIIVEAKKAGADAVKFQSFKAKYHYSKYSPTFRYLKTDTYKLVESLELNMSWHKKLKEFCDKIGVVFFSTACDKEAIDSLEKLGVEIYKVSSFDMVDLDLIDYLAKTKKTVIVSTGMCRLDEIKLVYDVMKKNNNEKLILLECTSLYPTKIEQMNLRGIQTLKNNFKCIVGLSDHTTTTYIPLAGAVMGAKVIEKHFTLNKNDIGPDHNFALEPKEFKQMVQYIRGFEKACGDGIKAGPRDFEREMWQKGRRSLHVNKDMKRHEILTKEDIICKRPGLGIHPKYKKSIIGKKFKKNIIEDMWITDKDI